ncbi:MAG: DUF1311 domain-containing protein [Bernardetiaceae bacterium]|nr:DUF1311 domain-containing protein [Bernardetiaceae bacterium]
MKTKLLYSLLCLLFFAVIQPMKAQEQPNFSHIYQIDAEAEVCLKKKTGQSLVQIECEIERYKKWSQALDEVYDHLSKIVSDEERKILAQQQEAWLSFRERKLEFDDLHYGNAQMLLASRSKADFVRTRTLELLHYIDTQKKKNNMGSAQR